MAVPRINRVQSERVLRSSGKGNEGNIVYTRGRKTTGGRRWNKKERERDSRVGCGTHPRGGGGGGGNSRLVNAVAMEGGEEKDRERKSSSFVCGGSRVACGLRILHGTWLAHPPPSTRFIQRLCHSHVTTPLRVPENTPLYFTFQPLAAVVYAFPSSVSLRNRCNFFLTAVLKHFYRVGGSFVFSPSWWRNRSVK